MREIVAFAFLTIAFASSAHAEEPFAAYRPLIETVAIMAPCDLRLLDTAGHAKMIALSETDKALGAFIAEVHAATQVNYRAMSSQGQKSMFCEEFVKSHSAVAQSRKQEKAEQLAKDRAVLPHYYTRAIADIESGRLTLAKMKEIGELDILLSQCATPENNLASQSLAFYRVFNSTDKLPGYEKQYAAYVAGNDSAQAKSTAAGKLKEAAEESANKATCAAAAKKYPDFKITGWQN